VYGQPEQLPVTETAPDRNAMSPYGFTKIAGEQMLRDLCASDPTGKSVLLRYFNPIGAHPSAQIGELPLGVPNNLVPFVTQTAAGLRKQLTVFGTDYDTPDGTCIRDYIHIKDLAQAHILGLQPGKSGFFNLGNGDGYSVKEVIETCEKVTGKKITVIEKPRRAGDPPRLIAAANKAHTELGWKPQYPKLEDIVKTAWAWHLKNPTGYAD
jgi:UDP-glucose 4-epimerase